MSVQVTAQIHEPAIERRGPDPLPAATLSHSGINRGGVSDHP